MKQTIFLFISAFLFISKNSYAQISHVIVEKYYVSDSLDATDTIDGLPRMLPDSSITYRIYVQVDSGYKVRKIYGTPCHPLRITSTAPFYNNINRPDEYFGYLIKKQYFPNNPLLALDSWLTLGVCAKTNTVNYLGVLKADDTDGSIIGGSHNNGGTAGVTSGLLINNDISVGIPVDTADGMIPGNEIYSGWSDNGFNDSGLPASGVDTTVFGSVNVGSQFFKTNAFLQQNSGVAGDAATGHKVLVAQVTTKGEITFELNLELIDSTGGPHTGDLLNFVASPSLCDSGGVDTTVLGMLKYPPDAPVCGCGDPNFLEYNANSVCYSQDSCHTRIVFGCMDSLACNYDPHANYNIQYLCCYPGKCNDRDISLVCPGIVSGSGFSLYPNPAANTLNLQISSDGGEEIVYTIYDSFGTKLTEKNLGALSGVITEIVDVSNLHPGLYLVRVNAGGDLQSKTFMKN